MAPHGVYPCKGEGDDWVSIACADEAEWRSLCTVIDPALASDARFRAAPDRKLNEDSLDEAITAYTQLHDRWDVTRALQAVGVAAFPSMTPADIADDPHLGEQGFLARLEHPEVGVRTHAGIPWRLESAPGGVRTAAPQLGAHTHEVLSGLLGYSEERIQQLLDDKVLY